MTKTQTVTLPIGDTPKGRGWTLYSGNTFLNVWKRPTPRKRKPTSDAVADAVVALLRRQLGA